MEYLIGLILSLTVDGSGTVIGYDRGRAFYPTALSVTASQLLGAAPPQTFEHFVDGDTAATYLGITRRTLLQKVRDRKIPGHALDPSTEKKDWRFLLSELHAYMVSCETRPPGARKPPRRV